MDEFIKTDRNFYFIWNVMEKTPYERDRMNERMNERMKERE